MPKISKPTEPAKDTLNKNLDIPKSMGKYKARKVLILIRRFDRLAVNTPGQVPIDGYLKLLNAFDDAIKQIKDEKTNDTRPMAQDGNPGRSAAVGEGIASSEHSRVSADNPLAGTRPDSA